MLTRPTQWRRIFDADGRLLRVEDAAGRWIEIERDSQNGQRITRIIGAGETSGRMLSERMTFHYDPNSDLLTSIEGPDEETWTFEYNVNGRLKKITYPEPEEGPTPSLEFTYNANHRIRKIIDENETFYQYSYTSHRLTLSEDPADPNAVIAEQSFEYEFTLSGPTWPTWLTWYVDRYESEWTYEFDVIGRYVKRHAPDPNSSPTVIAYDAEHNVTSYSAGGAAALTATWGPSATLTFLRLPGAGFVEEDEWNEVTFDWERPDPNGLPNFWRITYAEDALGNDVQFFYEDPNDATRNTAMIETLDGEDPAWVDGRENIIPSTGFGGFERYWMHDGFRSAACPLDGAIDYAWPLANAYFLSSDTLWRRAPRKARPLFGTSRGAFACCGSKTTASWRRCPRCATRVSHWRQIRCGASS